MSPMQATPISTVKAWNFLTWFQNNEGYELRGNRMNCIFHDDHSQDLRIFHDGFYCYACKARGDILDWVMQTQGCASPIIAARALLGDVSVPVSRELFLKKVEAASEVKPVRDWTEFAQECHDHLVSNRTKLSGLAWEYIESRGLTAQVGPAMLGVSSKGICGLPSPGWHGRLTLPYLGGVRVYHINARSLDPNCPKKFRYLNSGGQIEVYGADALQNIRSGETVVLVEGEVNALSLRVAANEVNLRGVRISGLAGWAGLKARDVERFEGQKVLVLMDYDAAGEAGRERCVKLLKEVSAYPAICPQLGDGDVNDLLREHGAEWLGTMLGIVVEKSFIEKTRRV